MFSDPQTTSRGPKPGTHHIDRRADALLAANDDGGPDDLLSTKDLAAWLGLNPQTVKLWRLRGTGPKFVKLGAQRVRYRRGDVLSWLKQRTRART